MRRIAARPPQRRLAQRGQVVVGLLAILGIGFGAAFYAFVSPTGSAIERDKITAAALAQAKDALIGYAAGQPNGGSYRPGELPCPDTNNDGGEESSCDTAASRVGRLPWKKLGLPDLRDGAGERLWYAVSNVFKNSSQTGVLNTDTAGDYTITGNTPDSNVIAIVFAPGAALGAQMRDTANENNIANYLEGENANGDTVFTTAPPSSTFNDKLLLITRDNFFPAITMRVAREARYFLNEYYSDNNYFPNANPFSDATYRCNTSNRQGRIPRFINAGCGSQNNWSGSSVPQPWFFANNWHHVLFYAVSSRCIESASWWLCPFSGGDLTVSGVSSNTKALVIATGRGFTGQNRPCATVSDCLEDTENTNGNDSFVKPVLSPPTNNDQLVIVAP